MFSINSLGYTNIQQIRNHFGVLTSGLTTSYTVLVRVRRPLLREDDLEPLEVERDFERVDLLLLVDVLLVLFVIVLVPVGTHTFSVPVWTVTVLPLDLGIEPERS